MTEKQNEQEQAKDETKVKGGLARAAALTPEERADIARRAARARWETPVLKAEHIGMLKIGEVEIECAVLEDGTRVLWQKSFLRAIGRKGEPKVGAASKENFQLPVFLQAANLKPFISEDLVKTSNHILFRPLVGGRGNMAVGYKAELLPEVCNVFIDAKEANALLVSQMHIYQRCLALLRGFAVVGITALVDEATGYQEIRDKLALREILDRFLMKEYAKWAKRFPDEFYREMFRLKGWEWRGMRVNRPSVVGKYTNDLVYERLLPSLLDELQSLNPKDDKGNRKAKHHQFFTEDIGHPKLTEHIYGILGLMRASNNWEEFHRLAQRAFPKYGTQLLLPNADANFS